MKKLNLNIAMSRIGGVFLLLLLLGTTYKSSAQTAASYGFSTSSTTYTAITGGTLLSSGTTMDDAKFSVTIPSFTFLGTAYTQAYVTENGYVQFGTAIPTALSAYLSTTGAAHTQGIAAYNRDLKGRATSSLRMETIGSEVIFQWSDLTNFASTAQVYNFQLRLNTSSGEIRVVYGTFSTTAATTGQVGLRGSTTDFNVRTTTSSWAASSAATVNTATMDVTATVVPASGLTYIWNPPVPCTAKPVGGTTVSSAGAAVVCPGTPVTLAVSGSSVATGLAYQWEYATTSTGPWTPLTGATAATYVATGPSCTNGYYRRVTTCTAVSLSDASAPVMISVKCALLPPYKEDFESITAANTLPNCMTATSLGTLVTSYLTAPGTYFRTNHTPSGSKFASFRYGANDYMFTPPIVLTAGKLYEFSFWYITDGLNGWDSLKLLTGSSATPAAMVTQLGPTLTGLKNTTYQKFRISFTATTSGEQVFAIYCKATSAPWYLTIDDIGLQEVPECTGTPAPGMPSATPGRICGIGRVELDLPALPLALGYRYQWQDSIAGGTWGTGGGRPTDGGNVIPFKTDDIAVTTYFRCIVTCVNSGISTVSSTVSVSAGPFEPPYVETFEGISVNNELPPCMSSTSATTVLTYTANQTTYNRINHTTGGSKFASFRYLCDDYLFSPPIKMIAGYQYILSYWYITDGLAGWNTLGAKVGRDATATGMTISLKSISSPRNTTYQQYLDTFIVPTTGVYYVGIYCNGTISPWYITVDDIGVNVRPCNAKPAAGAVTGTSPSGAGVCAGNVVTLSTLGATPKMISGIQYQWQRRNLSSPTAWINVAGATDSFLKADTLGGYEYRMVVVCTNTNDSTFTPAYALPQLPAHPPVTISPSVSPVSFCLGDTVKFNATNYAGTIYDWMKDSSVITGWKFSDFGATESGTYMVRATSGGTPCPAYSNMVKLVVNDPGYSVTITAPADSIVCAGTAIFLTGSASKPGLTYQWTRDNVDIPGAVTSSYLASTSGSYRIEAFDGASLCPAVSRTIRITVKDNPPATIFVPGGNTVACENEGVLLKVNSGLFSYEWARNGTTVVGMNDSNHLIKSSGTYRVKVRSADGCVSLSSPVSVSILPSPVPTITRTGKTLGTTSPYVSYKWVRDSKDTLGTSNTFFLVKKGLYKVVVEDANGCIGVSAPIEANDAELSIDDVTSQNGTIKVYPNPSTGIVNIESPVKLDVEVKDVTGKSVLSAKEATEINLGAFPDGIYILFMTDNNNVTIQQRVTKLSGK